MQLWPTWIHYICFCFLFMTIIAAWVMPPWVWKPRWGSGNYICPVFQTSTALKRFPFPGQNSEFLCPCKEIKSNFLYLNCKGLPCSGEKGNTQERNAYGTKPAGTSTEKPTGLSASERWVGEPRAWMHLLLEARTKMPFLAKWRPRATLFFCRGALFFLTRSSGALNLLGTCCLQFLRNHIFFSDVFCLWFNQRLSTV